MGPSQHAHILILDRPIELRNSHFVICRSLDVDWLLQSVGLSAFIGKWLVVKFRKLRAYFFREAFTKFYDIRSLSPISLYTFGYMGAPGNCCGGVKPRLRKIGTRGGEERKHPSAGEVV